MLPSAGLHIDQAPPLHLPFRFFATAPIFAILTGCAVLFWGGEVLLTPLLSVTVATLHLTLLGWLLMSICGAMIQMIPVLAGIPVPWPRGIPWVHALLTIGVLSLFVGLVWQPWVLPVALGGVGLAVTLFFVLVAVALVKAPAKHPTVNAMRIALLSLAGTLILGALFLFEYWHGFLDLDRYALVGIHLVWGLLGTMGTLIVGVSFQVLPMFYMTPEFPSRSANWILIGMGLFLVLFPVALIWAAPPGLLYVAALPGVGAIALYGVEVRRMLQQRKRKLVDATLRLWIFGFACAVAALSLLALWPVQEDERWRFLFGILYVLGWVMPIIVGMLHKIVPFLVWFHWFSPLAGLREIPMMDDLSPLRVVNAQVVIVVGTVVALVVAVFTGWDLAVRLGGVGLIAVGGVSLYALWFALRVKPPKMPEVPDFASFFKDMVPPPQNR
ncbi:MAG: hypothetical protein HQL93_12750 [Magnetococcales bacterium]|nr:hypothetical protein [Magnetococcales bacterium]